MSSSSEQRRRPMGRRYKGIFLLLLCLPAWAQAQAFKCRLPSGQVTISSTPCQDGSKTEAVVPAEVIPEARRQQAMQEQQLRLRQIEALEAQRRQEARMAAEAARSRRYGEAIRACVADVERTGVAERDRTELIAACQDAGVNQEKRQVDAELVRACVINVERQPDSGHDKARAIASCHGATLPERPAVAVPVLPPAHRPGAMAPGRQADCVGGDCEHRAAAPSRGLIKPATEPRFAPAHPPGNPKAPPREPSPEGRD
ncbi:MAG: DUF4124 domain-containing protein [Azovibrio sp.]|uniref:DUF4124 domain-containing protein n=1 Tax=Azovibrio sp. TaxID=1872673 RepID=UPI003C76113A